MAKKSKKKSKDQYDEFDDSFDRTPYLKEETMRIIYAIIFFLIAVFLIFASIPASNEAQNAAGPVGKATYNGLHFLLGIGYYLLPLLLIIMSVVFIKSLKQRLAWPKLISAFIFLLSSLSIISILFKDELTGEGRGGMIGNLISLPLVKLFDVSVSLIFLIGLVVITCVIMIDTDLSMGKLLFWRKKSEDDLDDDVLNEDEVKNMKLDRQIEKPKQAIAEDDIEDEEVGAEKDAVPAVPQKGGLGKMLGFDKKKEAGEFSPAITRFMGKEYTPPPLTLLNEDKGKPGVGDIKANANIIKRTLQNFGISVEMDEISIGPSVTRYALKPAEGVKLARIVGLQNDLALALAAHPIRIEAPIPGKSLVGIEIPNSTKTTVGLGTLLASDEYRQSDKPLLMGLGRGVSGKQYFANLAKMPHLLIAGATGSGKSVTIHTLLTSLLYRNSPENLKFIMIDPKRVELTLYNNIPHLLTPVITDAKKAILALKWAAKEMDRRYDVLEAEKVRDIESYHKNVLGQKRPKITAGDEETIEQAPETMPYLIVIIDELADLMQTYPRELESAIVRLAQMSRAVGIHLILSTQRPSVNVITGLIKANIPSRIALQVTSQIDSRTILDAAGAEKLLGAGDMLYMSGDMSKPARVQSAFISESELKSVVKYLIDNYADEIPSEINLTETAADRNSIFESSFDEGDGEEDDLYEEAREIVVQAGKASTSYLQRKLRVGYARAARLIDMLEERGVIGPGEGAKPREVINPAGGGSDGAADREETI